MFDFLKISTRSPKRDVVEIYPGFRVRKSSDLMIRGGDFYAIWDEERGLWSTDEDDVTRLVDRELKRYYEEYKASHDGMVVRVMYMEDSDSGSIDKWHKYCQKQMRDSYHTLDETLIFSNHETKKKDYASKRLDYPLEEGDISAWNQLVGTLYSEEEKQKIEWAIGSIVAGESKNIQKFCVLYGEGGTGKSTVLNIIQKIFNGYDTVFDAKALGSSNNTFALEAFKNNPIVAIQHDGDLSRIEDNTMINSLVSHETMRVNEKFKPSYPMRFNAFLFMGTNKPVKITDGKSGIIRRLIDISPTGNKLPKKEYMRAFKQINFELGAIAYHCKEVYLSDPGKYDDYIPISMLGASNDFYNFVVDSYHIFVRDDGVSLKSAWEMYKTYCEEAKVPYPYSQRNFKEELKNYFWKYEDRYKLEDGSRVRSYYSEFRTDKFEQTEETKVEVESKLIDFKEQKSIFDKECSDCFAQYATSKETPRKKWEEVNTKLSELDTSKVHYVKVPENHIVIDFDIPNKDGGKSFERNVEEASKWPATYAELSKSGAGVHLHYLYSGDVSKLSRVYDDHIEVKVFTGKSSLRRKLTKCNDIPIATISSGLPLKGDQKMVNNEAVKNEKGLRTLIKRNLNKEYHPATKPSIDFIHKILEDAYNSDLCYDVSDMFNPVLAFAVGSTNQSDYCIKRVSDMKFKSENVSEIVDIGDDKPIIFYDIEVFPNLFLVNWKVEGEGKPVVRMINPKPSEIENLIQHKLVGFNCRRYDNHILYARLMGYSNEQLYKLSQKIINGDGDAFFGEAYNISYTDVFDYCSKKQSLKKWEIELGIHHQELGLPWDQPVPEELWPKVAEYCDNDVIATEAVFNATSSDWIARQILADVAGMSVNSTTNQLTTRIIFGTNKKPQDQFNYRNLAEPISQLTPGTYEFLRDEEIIPMNFDKHSILPYFPGYKFEAGVSTYKGEEVGEGGYVYAEPGIHGNVALLDVASMHPASMITECIFGPKYTKLFKDLRDSRVYIKRKDFDHAKKMLDGKLAKYLESDLYTPKDLAQGLKIAINSVYGLTAAKFDNPFRDIRNKDNIVAKRGALFMIDLKYAVQEKGYTVVHVKTDSIKIADADQDIIDFVMEFGRKYGYEFEHEATYDKMCLVNDAVYIAKYSMGGEGWTATGAQFAVPYVYKKLFSREPIVFEDLCETKSVTTALYLDMNENYPDVSEFEELKNVRRKYPDWTLHGFEATKKADKLLDKFKDISDEELEAKIAEGHNYKFVGKVGNFCPVEPGACGGWLMREGKDKDGNPKYFSATGAKGHRWLEAEMVLVNKDLREKIDYSYFNKLVDDAADAIGKYGDVEWFTSDEVYEGSFVQASNLCPF